MRRAKPLPGLLPPVLHVLLFFDFCHAPRWREQWTQQKPLSDPQGGAVGVRSRESSATHDTYIATEQTPPTLRHVRRTLTGAWLFSSSIEKGKMIDKKTTNRFGQRRLRTKRRGGDTCRKSTQTVVKLGFTSINA